MSDKQIDPRHRDLADQLCLAAVDGDDVAFFDSLAEVVDAGIRAAVSVCGCWPANSPRRRGCSIPRPAMRPPRRMTSDEIVERQHDSLFMMKINSDSPVAETFGGWLSSNTTAFRRNSLQYSDIRYTQSLFDHI